MMYRFVNAFMHCLHFVIIFFSLTGWLVRDFVPLYLFFHLAILGSWLGYGLYDGRWGRCLITDIHWHLKEKAGKRPKTESFVDYWVHNKFGFSVSEQKSEWVTLGIFFGTSLIGLFRFFFGF